jgi:ABC-type phosphate/phosphonate transport system substrate-binding protein
MEMTLEKTVRQAKKRKAVAGFIAAVWITGFPVWTSSAAEVEPIPCKIGYSIKTIVDVDARDMEAAFRVWSRELAAQYGFQVDTVLYDSTDKLIADFRSKKLDFAAVTSLEFLRVAKVINVKPEVTQCRNGKSFVKYLLLVSAEERKKGLAGLKSKRLSLPKGNALASVFLDANLMKAGLPASGTFFSDIRERGKETQAVLDVFFGQADACVVSEDAFRVMKEMNPQIGDKLHVAAESQALITSIGFFRPDWPEAYKRRGIEAMRSDAFKRHERGRQIMLLLNVERIDVITDDQLKETRALLAEYERLKKNR